MSFFNENRVEKAIVFDAIAFIASMMMMNSFDQSGMDITTIVIGFIAIVTLFISGIFILGLHKAHEKTKERLETLTAERDHYVLRATGMISVIDMMRKEIQGEVNFTWWSPATASNLGIYILDYRDVVGYYNRLEVFSKLEEKKNLNRDSLSVFWTLWDMCQPVEKLLQEIQKESASSISNIYSFFEAPNALNHRPERSMRDMYEHHIKLHQKLAELKTVEKKVKDFLAADGNQKCIHELVIAYKRVNPGVLPMEYELGYDKEQ